MRTKFASTFVLLGLSACASPKMKYDLLRAGDQSGAQRFQISDSQITFSYPSTGPSVAPTPDTTKMVVTSTPIAWAQVTYTVAGVPWTGDWGTQTDVTLTHSQTSLLATQMGTQVTDEVQTVATDAGSVAQGALTLGTTLGLFSGMPAVPPAAKLQDTPPTGLLISQFIEDAVNKKLNCNVGKPLDAAHTDRDEEIVCTGLTLSGGGKVNPAGNALLPYVADVDIGAVPVDAFKIAKYPYYSKAMIYSACRPITITVYDPTSLTHEGKYTATMVVSTTLIADPTWFESTAIPPNGHASLNSACGADSATGTYTPPDGLKDAGAILTAINNAASSLKSQKSSGAK